MNFIGIDPSIISTGLCISKDDGAPFIINFTRESDVYGKKTMKKWYKKGEEAGIIYKYLDYSYDTDTYSDSEIEKLDNYDKATDLIISTIKEYIDPDQPSKVAIEGYSYSSGFGDIIDLVTFSTLLRLKIYEEITQDITVKAPASLKLEAAKLTYPPIVSGKRVKKYSYKNYDGISGGNFTKREMLQALTDNTVYKDPYIMYLKENKDELMFPAKINKPFEDCDDAYIMLKWLLKTDTEAI